MASAECTHSIWVLQAAMAARRTWNHAPGGLSQYRTRDLNCWWAHFGSTMVKTKPGSFTVWNDGEISRSVTGNLLECNWFEWNASLLVPWAMPSAIESTRLMHPNNGRLHTGWHGNPSKHVSLESKRGILFGVEEDNGFGNNAYLCTYEEIVGCACWRMQERLLARDRGEYLFQLVCQWRISWEDVTVPSSSLGVSYQEESS